MIFTKTGTLCHNIGILKSPALVEIVDVSFPSDIGKFLPETGSELLIFSQRLKSYQPHVEPIIPTNLLIGQQGLGI